MVGGLKEKTDIFAHEAEEWKQEDEKKPTSLLQRRAKEWAPSSLLESDATEDAGAEIEQGLGSADALTREHAQVALRQKIAAADEEAAKRKVEEAEKDTDLWEKRATDVLETPDARLEPSSFLEVDPDTTLDDEDEKLGALDDHLKTLKKEYSDDLQRDADPASFAQVDKEPDSGFMKALKKLRQEKKEEAAHEEVMAEKATQAAEAMA